MAKQKAASRRKKGPLPPNHYRLHVTYAPLPSQDALKREFGENNVSDLHDGRAWTKHPSCVGMDETPGERIFLAKDFGRDWDSDEAIAWGEQERTEIAPSGYRPATREEEYEFQKAHPELYPLVALGSFTLLDGGRCVAVLRVGDGERIFGGHWFDHGWGSDRRFLFVRK